MKPGRILLISLAAFLLSAGGSWLFHDPQLAAAGRKETPDTLTIPGRSARTADSPSLTTSPGLEMLRREMLESTGAIQGLFSGERLEELLRESFPEEGPGPEDPDEYAEEWCRLNPRAVLAWGKQRGSFEINEDRYSLSLLHTLFLSWARQDQAAAFEAYSRLSEPDRAEALHGLIRGLVMKDPALAARLAAENMKDLASGGFGRYLSTEESWQLWLALKDLPEGDTKVEILIRLLHQPGVEASIVNELPAEIKRAMLLKTGDHWNLRTAILRSDDGKTVLRELAQSTGRPDLAQRWLDMRGESLSATDVSEALRWVQSSSTGEQRVKAVVEILQSVAEENTQLAMEVWHTLPEGILRARAAGAIARVDSHESTGVLKLLSPADAARAVEWIEKESRGNGHY